MLEFKRLKRAYDMVTNPKRYRNDSDTSVDLDETTTPASWRDETSPTLRERIASRKRFVLLFGYLGTIVLGVLAVHTNRLFPGLTSNPFLWEAIKWLVVVPVAVWLGTRAIRSKLEQVDWLILLRVTAADQETDGTAATGETQGGLGFYVGNRSEDSDGNAVFEPVKGFSLMGLRGEYVTLGDLDDDFARHWSKQGRQSDEPARIRLEDAIYADREAFLGRLTAVLTGGLALDPFGQHSDLYTKEPALVDPERYRKLAETIDDYRRDRKQLETQLDSVKDDRDHWRQEANQKREEIRREIITTHGKLAESGFGPQRSRQEPRQSEGERFMQDGGAD